MSEPTNDKSIVNFTEVSQFEFSELLSESVLLGVGSFGTVFRIPWNDGSAALKVYRNEHATEDVWREISLLAKCDHPNIVKILGAGPSFPRKIFFLVMEYAECFSVNDVLYKLPDVHYELTHCLHWVARAADGSDYLLHKCQPPVVHGDLKPANLLLFNCGLNLKLTDFGSARSLDANETRRPGTLIYTAPEISCVREGMPLEYTEKSDVYSLIISLWEILARQKPYADSASKCKLTIFWSVFRRRPTPLQKCPPLLSKLLERGWNEDPCIRPTMHQISSILDTVLRILLSPDRELPSLQIPSHLPQHEAPLFSDTCNPEPLGPHFINEVCWQLPFGTCFFSPNIL
ncbi:Mitogen-activated protein kinase kinase kinase [Fasciolopsis buskii]|uniref:Mitogen-activated protein kinase kinase kinase n=1 Tax=Fasciolopsis buskii TaxID=27845 RepID=A0A8E0RZ73_9TREM|nr:Mitogen-activated protein kinase kinase kinase [Fasciolopsis buski]